jgi:hypothetical protein
MVSGDEDIENRRPPSQQTISPRLAARIDRLHAQGRSVREVASELRYSAASSTRHFQTAGLPSFQAEAISEENRKFLTFTTSVIRLLETPLANFVLAKALSSPTATIDWFLCLQKPLQVTPCPDPYGATVADLNP